MTLLARAAAAVRRALRDDPPDATLLAPLSDPLAPYRPDAGGVWPDSHLTLSYGELRALIALHLDLCWQGMPGAEPWAYVRARSAAMRDGETPLLVGEVLE